MFLSLKSQYTSNPINNWSRAAKDEYEDLSSLQQLNCNQRPFYSIALSENKYCVQIDTKYLAGRSTYNAATMKSFYFLFFLSIRKMPWLLVVYHTEKIRKCV